MCSQEILATHTSTSAWYKSRCKFYEVFLNTSKMNKKWKRLDDAITKNSNHADNEITKKIWTAYKRTSSLMDKLTTLTRGTRQNGDFARSTVLHFGQELLKKKRLSAKVLGNSSCIESSRRHKNRPRQHYEDPSNWETRWLWKPYSHTAEKKDVSKSNSFYEPNILCVSWAILADRNWAIAILASQYRRKRRFKNVITKLAKRS